MNVLNIERIFIDKVFAIKRHSISETISSKVRHIYDVYMLYQREDIQKFINDKVLLKEIISVTKESDKIYLTKRSNSYLYNPLLPYDFESWKNKLDDTVKRNYENLHKNLLFTNEKQDFSLALEVLEKINCIFKDINE